MMYGYEMTGAGAFWMVLGLVVIVLAILGGAWLIARSMQTSRESRSAPLDILKERLARGEISGDEFDKAKQALR
jgi:uncharacterized membrane protein